MAGSLGRKPYTIFEIDVPRCTRVYGSSPCTAALSATTPNKCYNTFKTCQDEANYDAGTVTHSYVMNVDGMPKEAGFFPMLASVSTRPAQINLSGIDPNTTALGVRASGTATLMNAKDNGSFTDPYAAERRTGAAQFSGVGYKPEDFGSHWGKFFARTPYYVGLECRVKRGYVGDDPALMPVEHYVITEATGPGSDGRVSIEYKDILDLTAEEKSQCPAVSTGKLLEEITAGASTATLTPAGIGDEEYPASGFVVIGSEIIAFTRSGDVLTLTDRGAEGTTAASHAALDVVQLCAVFDAAERFCDVVYDLLVNYASVPASYITLAEWQAEHDAWLAGVTIKKTIIPKPTAVRKLIGELCQLGVFFFPDVTARAIRYKVNAPLRPGETYYDVTDANNLREGTVSLERGEDQRISAIILWHGSISWTASATDTSNYAKATVARVGNDPYDQSAIKEITMRWFGADGDDAAASVVTERLLSRFKNPPKIISGELDVKDRSGVELASRLRVTSAQLEDENGASLPELMQVSAAEYTTDDRVEFTAQTYTLDGRFGFWMDSATAPTYSTATDAEKTGGAYWMDDAVGTFSDGSGPYVYF